MAASADRVIADLAATQHGVVSRRQLMTLGIPTRMIDWRVEVGRLHPMHRGVYLVGHAAAPETVRGTLALLDTEGIEGELALREARSGRVEVVQMWGRTESVRQEFNRRRSQ